MKTKLDAALEYLDRVGQLYQSNQKARDLRLNGENIKQDYPPQKRLRNGGLTGQSTT